MFSKKRLKELLKLKTKKGRREKERFLIEGLKFCQELLNSSFEAELVLYTLRFSKFQDGKKLLDDFVKKGVEVISVKEDIIKKLSDTVTPQGIVGIVKMKKLSLSLDASAEKSLLKNTKSEGFIEFVLAIDSIKEPGNLGTMIRTADAAGVFCVLLSEGCVELYNPKVLRSTMGSVFHLPIFENMNLEKAILYLKKRGFKIFAADVKEGKLYDQIDYLGKVCLIIGSEAQGISEKLLSLAFEKVKIPLYGKAESLNAAVACGIILYQIAKKRADKV